MNIGKKIKALRCNMNLTQEELAAAVNTTKQTIHKYETGIISNIPAGKIKAIADRLNTTPAYLMGWDELPDKAEQSDDELDREIIEGYSRLTDENKKIVSDLIQALLSSR